MIQNTKIVYIFASGKYLHTLKYSTMKETINVNIAGQAFTMDMDAYSALTSYLDDISRRLPETDTETMAKKCFVHTKRRQLSSAARKKAW